VRGNAHAERDVNTTFAHVEAGRMFPTAFGRITPYASMRHAVSHGDAFAESGGTGFELVGGASRHVRTIGELGARLGDDLRWGDAGWLQWHVAAHYRPLYEASDDMPASFAGVPGYWFDLQDAPYAHDAFGWEASLLGGIGQRWSWRMRYEDGEERAVSLGVGFTF
jgi:outer membrane autotransporter protein